MNGQLYRECELKFKISNQKVENDLYKLILEKGYTYYKAVLQTDFILDTIDYSCKDSNLLFRIREEMDTNSKNSVWIITIKIKGRSKNFQDNYEIEFPVDGLENIKHDLVVDVLKGTTSIKLSSHIFRCNNVENLIYDLIQTGFSEYSVMQKKRSYYKGSNSNVMFDIFPEPIGKFLEIETFNEHDLYETVKLLNLRQEEMEQRNYGKIVLDKNRYCIFESEFTMRTRVGKNVDFYKFIMNVVNRYINTNERIEEYK